MATRFPFSLLIGIVFTASFGLSVLVFQKTTTTSRISPLPPEIQSILATDDIREQKKLYRTLIERAGAEQAQQELHRSGLPFTGETHLLNHTVGEWLHEKLGAAGLSHCRDYFLASCYHGFILSAFEKGSPAQIEERVLAACARRGPAALAQCAHAFGHAFLVWRGYANLPDALRECDAAARRFATLPLFNCYDGAFMENIWGVHEGTPSPQRWIRRDDPTYPCTDPRIAERHRNGCWANQPALLYQLFAGDVRKVAAECLRLTDARYRATCFDGLARQLHPITRGDAEEAERLCNQEPAAWRESCLISVAQAAYSVGDRAMPFAICSRQGPPQEKRCWQALFGMIAASGGAIEERRTGCIEITDKEWRSRCLDEVSPLSPAP